jgi:hypothetical protein
MSNATQAHPSQYTTQRESHRSGETADLICHLKQYASDNPTTAALWCFGLGFFLGWKLRIW